MRRIDGRIRIPRESTLSNVLTGIDPTTSSFDEEYFRLPIAINRMNGLQIADQGQPTTGYAAVQMLEVEVYEEHLDELVFKLDGLIDSSVGFAAQPGQQLVDNTGVVRTVVGISEREADDDQRIVIVDPPFAFANAGGNDTDQVRPDEVPSSDIDERAQRSSWVRQVIFTPREPVAVRIVTLEVDS